MHYRLLDERDGRRSYAVALDAGEPVMETLTALARELSLVGSSITAIGGLRQARLGFFDPSQSTFVQNIVEEQVELLSFQGNIAEDPDGTPKLHAHVVLGRSDASTRGGHLIEATVRPTFEAIIVESPSHLHRVFDDATGLVLLKP